MDDINELGLPKEGLLWSGRTPLDFLAQNPSASVCNSFINEVSILSFLWVFKNQFQVHQDSIVKIGIG